jgi:hypothetical protein
MANARVPLNALQKAVFTKLNTDSGSWSTAASVYDEVPENASFPYVELGLFTDDFEGTKGKLYSENTQTIAVCSSARGAKELNAIIDQVVQSATDTSLEGDIDDDFRIFLVRLEMVEVFKITDRLGDTYRQGNVRVRFKVEDKLT